MKTPIQKAGYTRGFTLVQVSILLTVAALVMVAVLPGYQTTLNANNVTTTRMNAVLLALRQYQAANGVLPCPADASLPTGSANYGKAAANPGLPAFSLNGCAGSPPAANYHDWTNNIAVGMVPVRALGLSNDYALDGYGRYITYAVDTYATGNILTKPVWSVPAESGASPGKILVDDNGIVNNTVVALISHGADGHGAWLPVNAASGTGVRLNAGNTDNDEHLVNAHGSAGGTFPANHASITALVADAAGNTVTFVKKPPTSTFDDLVVYSSPLWNINQLPVAQQAIVSLSPPANGTYVTGEPLTFTATYPSAATVTGTPYISLLINNVARSASYASGSGTNTLTFSYTLAASDYAAETGSYGISLTSPINSSGGNISIANGNAIPMYFSSLAVAQSAYYNLSNGSYVLNGLGGGNATASSNAGVWATAPQGIAVDGSSNVWVTDPGNEWVEEFSSAYAWTRTAGGGGVCDSGSCTLNASGSATVSAPSTANVCNYTSGCTSGSGGNYFSNPAGLLYVGGAIWVVDSMNSRVEEINSSGSVVTQFGSSGGAGTPGKFTDPTNLAAGSVAGTVWVTDTGNNQIQLCNYASDTCSNVYGGATTYNGLALNIPTGIATDSSGNVYVVDTGNNRVVKLTSAGVYSTTFGSAGHGNAATSNFESPIGIAIDGSGNIWVADSMNNRVLKFNSSLTWQLTVGGGGLCATGATCTLNATSPATTTGSPSSAANTVMCNSTSGCAAGSGQLYFNNPTGITYSTSTGNLYVVDNNNNRIQIFTTAGAYVNQFTGTTLNSNGTYYGSNSGDFSF